VIRAGRAEVFTYDTTGDENSVFSLNMGCRGVVRILLEGINKNSAILQYMRQVVENRKPCVVATLINSNGKEGEVGARAFYEESHGFSSDGLPVYLQNLAKLKDSCAKALKQSPGLDSELFETPEGSFELSFEVIQPPISLLIFGAGGDAIPLANAANLLGWQVSVLDHRPAYLEESRFPFARDRILIRSDGPNPEIVTDDLTAAVIMSHNYQRDRENLAQALRSDAFYIAALGPKSRTEQILEELDECGETFSDKQLQKLHAPAGLDIGADTPESIALSIIAEIQAVLRNREGGFLRNRQGPIYERNTC
jgi:xanthine dehydrogenase accessory factor